MTIGSLHFGVAVQRLYIPLLLPRVRISLQRSEGIPYWILFISPMWRTKKVSFVIRNWGNY